MHPSIPSRLACSTTTAPGGQGRQGFDLANIWPTASAGRGRTGTHPLRRHRSSEQVVLSGCPTPPDPLGTQIPDPLLGFGWADCDMFLDYTTEQNELRQQLRDYFAQLLTDEVRAELGVPGEGGALYRRLIRQM